MAPKKEYIFGGVDGIICISAIILAIVFGLMWAKCNGKLDACDSGSTECNKQKRVYYKSSQDNATNVQCVNKCNADIYSMGIQCFDDGCLEALYTIQTADECSASCNEANKNNPITAP
jgi:hypothetical protein